MEIMEVKVIGPIVATGIVLLIKSLLDFHIAPYFVRWFSWVPLRGIFRTNPQDVSGDWDQFWEVQSIVHSEHQDRLSLTRVYQLNRYCYAEFCTIGKRYGLFGQVKSGFLVGDWYDLDDRNGYYGAFELEIFGKEKMHGKWIGHSKNEKGIKVGDWVWTRNESPLKLE